VLVDSLISIRIKLSYKLRSLLFAKDPSIKTISLALMRLIGA
jgi:hypothetical protein